MMLRKTPWMTLRPAEESSGREPFWLYNHQAVCCGTAISKLFDLPDSARKMRLVAYNRPGRFRVWVSKHWTQLNFMCPPSMSFVMAEGIAFRSTEWLSDQLQKLAKPTFYVECEWR